MNQRTPEWFAARIGKVTASRVSDVVAKTKTGYGASRANYMSDLLIERLTNRPNEGFSNAAMLWGTETEPLAREAYSAKTGELVEEVGFIPHPEIAGAGASPDGFVGSAGTIEIKCPNTATHIETLLSRRVPEKYFNQMQWQMACAERAWCDFVTFDPRLPENLQMVIFRVDRDDRAIIELESEVRKFLAELNEKLAKLKELGL
jgi:putative phage-type endonuclease